VVNGIKCAQEMVETNMVEEIRRAIAATTID
jgi:hypothetical protein